MPTELQHRVLASALHKYAPGAKAPCQALRKRCQFKHIPFSVFKSEGESILSRAELRRRRRARVADLERQLHRQDATVAKDKADARRRVEKLEQQLADVAEGSARIKRLEKQLAEVEGPAGAMRARRSSGCSWRRRRRGWTCTLLRLNISRWSSWSPSSGSGAQKRVRRSDLRVWRRNWRGCARKWPRGRRASPAPVASRA